MKKLLVCLSILVFVALAYADFTFEITQELKKKEAEITVTGKSFDEVWKATTRALMSLKFQIKESDKDSGTILAEKRKGMFYEDGDVQSGWSVMLEDAEEEIILFCVYQPGSSNPLSSGAKPFKQFRKKLKKRLSSTTARASTKAVREDEWSGTAWTVATWQEIKVYRTANEVESKYREVALLFTTTETKWASEEDKWNGMKKVAAEMGGNALILDAASEPLSGMRVSKFETLGSRKSRKGESAVIYVYPEDSK